jgi:hypothetical protein
LADPIAWLRAHGVDMKMLAFLKLAVGLVAVLALFAAAFVLPSHKPEPHHVPFGLVGPSSVANALERKRPGALDIKQYASESEARHAILHREVYGALLVEDRGSQRLLIASAASAAVAQMLRAAAEQRGTVEVEDVKPFVSEDPRGSTLNSLFLALIIASSIAVLGLTSAGLRGSKLIGAIALFAVLGGLTIAGLVAEGMGALPGSYLALSAVTALTILAVALPTAGLQGLLGQAGGALGGLFFVLLANPASGNASAPELLPGFWRAISQFMPPGAGGTSLRNTGYFDGNALLQPLLVLSAYAALGVLLVGFGEAVRRRRARHESDTTHAASAADNNDLKEAA